MNCGIGNSFQYAAMDAKIYQNYINNNKNAFSAELEKSKEQGNIHSKLKEMLNELSKDPIANMAGSDGYLEHNGVVLIVDNVHETISIGDVSDPENVFSVGLSTGYTLNVNRNNISSLANVLDLFTAEDVKRILHGLSTYKHAHEKMDELEDVFYKACDNIDDDESKSTKDGNVKSRSQENNENESDTNSNIVVNSDGTRVLVVTTRTAGGFTTTMSLKLSETNELDQVNKENQEAERQSGLFKMQAAIASYEK